jgi:hypothetical protein
MRQKILRNNNRQKTTPKQYRNSLISASFLKIKFIAKYFKHKFSNSLKNLTSGRKIYSVIQKDGFNFVRLYFLNYTWYVNDVHNI